MDTNTNKKPSKIISVIAVILLAGIAIFTAIYLYNKRQEAVAPTAPESKPAAAEPTLQHCKTVKFSLPVPIECNDECTWAADCPDGYKCYDDQKLGKKVCRNAACLWQTDCKCPVSACNSPCVTSENCLEDHFCHGVGGGITVCRDVDCPDREDCVCPSAPPFSYSATCIELKVFDENWVEVKDLTKLKAWQYVYIGVRGDVKVPASLIQTPTHARIRINRGDWQRTDEIHSTGGVSGSGISYFYIKWRVRGDINSFILGGELYHPKFGWF